MQWSRTETHPVIQLVRYALHVYSLIEIKVGALLHFRQAGRGGQLAEWDYDMWLGPMKRLHAPILNRLLSHFTFSVGSGRPIIPMQEV